MSTPRAMVRAMTDDPIDTAADREALSRTVAVLTGKGGVGKTSISANLSGQFAAGKYRVLAVDLDVSGNLALDLGYTSDPRDDQARSVLEAVWDGKPLQVIPEVRPGLDVLPGGRNLEMLASLATSTAAQELTGGSVPRAFAHALADIAGDYEIVVMDCAPGHSVLQEMALAAARYVLIPTRTDAAGWDGLRMIGPRVKRARAHNPDLTYLGAVLFDTQANATRVRRNTLARLDEVSDRVPLFEAFIRHSETAAHDCRLRGQLAHELAVDAEGTKAARFAALRDPNEPMPEALSQTAAGLSGDYLSLAREVLARIGSHEAEADRA